MVRIISFHLIFTIVKYANGLNNAAKLMDWNYRMTAKAVNFEIDRVQGDNMNHFPIERARVRLSEVIMLLRAASVIGYGWSLQQKAVSFKTSLLLLQLGNTNSSSARFSAIDSAVFHWVPRRKPGRTIVHVTHKPHPNIPSRHSIHC